MQWWTRQTSHAGIPPDCVRLAEKLTLEFRPFPWPLWFHTPECCGAVEAGTSMCRFKSVPTWRLRGPIKRMHGTLSAARALVLLLLSLLSMLSGEIYLRLKLYLVVKTYSDKVTEHCCQACILSMMFAALPLCADMVSDWAISRKLIGVPMWFDLTAAGQWEI